MGRLFWRALGTASLVGVAYLLCAIVAVFTLGLSPAWLLVLAANLLLVSACILLARVATNDPETSSRTEALTIGISTMAPLGTQAVQYLLQPRGADRLQIEASSVIGAAIVDLRIGHPVEPALVYLGVLLACTFVSGVVAVVGANHARRNLDARSSHWLAILLLTGSMLLLQPWFGGVVRFDPSRGLIDSLLALSVRVVGTLVIGGLIIRTGGTVREFSRTIHLPDRGNAAYSDVVLATVAVFVLWAAPPLLLYLLADSLTYFRDLFQIITRIMVFASCVVVISVMAFAAFGLPRPTETKAGPTEEGDGPAQKPDWLDPLAARLTDAATEAKAGPTEEGDAPAQEPDWLGPFAARLANAARAVAAAVASFWLAAFARLSGLVATLVGGAATTFSRRPRLSIAISVVVAAAAAGLLAWPILQNYSKRLAGQAKPPPATPRSQASQPVPEQQPAQVKFEEISISCLTPYWEYGKADRVSTRAVDCAAYSPADILIAVGSATPRGGSVREIQRSQDRGEQLADVMLRVSQSRGQSQRIYVLNRGIETRGNVGESRTGPLVRALAGRIVPENGVISDEMVARNLALFLGKADTASYSICQLSPYPEKRTPDAPGPEPLDCATKPPPPTANTPPATASSPRPAPPPSRR